MWCFWKLPNILFSGLVLMISLGTLTRHVHYSFSSDRSTPDHTRVASFNVRVFDLYNWKSNKQTRDSILGYLADLDADILCLQEFYKTTNLGYFNTLDTLLTIQHARNAHEEYSTASHKGKHKYGIVTLSSYPVIAKGRVPMSTNDHNLAIWTDLLVDQDTLRVFNMHLASLKISHLEAEIHDHIEKEDFVGQLKNAFDLYRMLDNAFKRREVQAKAVRKAIDTCPHPFIVCGDMNDTPGSYAYHLISKDLNDAFMEYGRGAGSTYIGFYPSFRIDYILYSPELNVSSFRTENVKLSDHRPVTSTFSFAASEQ